MADHGSKASGPDLGAAVNALAEGQKAFGRYTLMKIVGRSATSVVWLAWDEKQDRDVALKFLPEITRPDPSAVVTLKRAIRKLIESVKHDKIVQIFDLEQDGSLVAVPMEYVEGTSVATLRSQRDNQVFAPQDVTDWMQQLCEVLEYAHNDLTLAHGDLRPSNLIINQKGVLKVSDFALEPYLSEFLSRTTDLPGGGYSPTYWSPQRAEGGAPTPVDDIYSIGATLYELLTSKPPFYTGDIALQIGQKVPPPMVHRRKELRVIGEPISRIWEETVAACLAKDPAQRPQTIGQIIERLELEAAPSVEMQEKPAAPAPKPANNKLLIVVAVVVFVLLGIAGLFVGSGSKSTDTGTNRIATVTAPADTEALAAAEKLRQQAEDNAKKAEKRSKEADDAVKAAQEQARKYQQEIEAAKKQEAQRVADAEKKRKEAEAERLAAETRAKQLADEVDKARKAAESGKSEAETKALREAEAKVKAAQDEAARLQKQIDQAKQMEAKKALEAEAARKTAEAKKSSADDNAKRLAALAEQQMRQEAVMLADQKLKEAEAKRLVDEAARQEAARKAADQKAVASAQAKRKLAPGKPWENSLGMRFVPVGDVMFCVWECRVSDFNAFIAATRIDAGPGWRSPGFKQEDSHPVVNVNRSDAQAFCNWLTQKEAGDALFSGYAYRLPTDQEWSLAVGLTNESGATPADRHGRIRAVYPWGTAWPPPPGAGNYADNISYDRFENTAPVASFMPNQSGIFDLAGNVWEWCSDWSDSSQTAGVLRGGAYTGYAPGALYSSYRLMVAPGDRRADAGFRCVLAKPASR